MCQGHQRTTMCLWHSRIHSRWHSFVLQLVKLEFPFGVKKCLPFYEGRYQVSCMGATFALFDESKTAVMNKDAFLAGSLSNFAF